jgi:(p)ppGpp synthase/HD superfamily hydrolase
VNINTFKNRYSAVKHWIDYIHTPSAHGQLVKHIRMQEREARLDEAIEGLNGYLKTFGLPQFRSDKDKIQKLGDPLEVERRILLVLDRQDTYGNIVRTAYPNLMKTLHEKTALTDTDTQQQALRPTTSPLSTDVSMEVIVDNDKSLYCIFCPECNPHPGNKIIAKSGKEGIKIHTMQCKAVKTLSYAALLEAHRKADALSTTYTIHTQLKFSQDKMTIVDIIALFSAFSIPIFKFELEKAEDNHMIVQIAGEVSNPAKL